MLTQVIFWGSALALVYLYVGYPASIWAWGRLRPRPHPRGTITPKVSVLIAACNEAERIGGRLDNLLAQRYPARRLEILVGSDGSTDATARLARGRSGVRVFDFPKRRGKPAVLNDLAARARGEILVLADARQRWDPDALRALVAPFVDARVGAVSGQLVLGERAESGASSGGVGFYWRYETFIRAQESRVDSTIGATGAIYAVRRSYHEPLPPDTLLDDVVGPLRVVRRGGRVLFEPRAVAYDRVASGAGEELARKARTIAGNFQLFSRETWLLDPLQNRLWIQTVSHKLLRLLSPALFLALLLSNLTLAGPVLYDLALSGQVVFYGAAALGALGRGRRRPWISVPTAVCLLNWATLVGFARWLRGAQSVAWEPATAHAPRSSSRPRRSA